MELVFPVSESLYYNISFIFVLHRCNLTKPSLEDPDIISEEDDEDVFESDTKNAWLWSYVNDLFGPPEPAAEDSIHSDINVEAVAVSTSHHSYQCVKIVNFSHEQSANARAVLSWTRLILMSILLCVLIWTLIYYVVKVLHRSRVKEDEDGQSSSCGNVIEEELAETSESLCNSKPDNDIVDSPVKTSKNTDKLENGISKHQPLSLANFKVDSGDNDIRMVRIDTACFLASTMDRFLNEMDRALGISSDLTAGQTASSSPSLMSSASSGAVSSLASPRFQRRTWRPPRLGPSPSLPLGNVSLMADEQVSKDRFAWSELERMNIKLGWSSLKCDDIDFGHLENRNLRDVLTFDIRNCPINTEQSLATSLMVNYSLLLLEKELQESPSLGHSAFRFVEFKGIGSVAKGLKISKANQFDVTMIIQPTDCTLHKVFYPDVSEDIPAGKLLLSVKDVKQDKKQKTYIKRASVIDSIGNYLLPREVHLICKNLIDHGLQRLMNNNKSVMDRLPFSIRIANESDLHLILDTRLLHGLGLGVPEIGIRLCPALPLLTSNLTLMPTLYAVCPWSPQLQSSRRSLTSSMRIFRRGSVEGLDTNLFWDLCFCDLESFYLSAMDQKFQLAGINGCHRICLKIMKALFSSGYKTNLLSRGEIDSYQIETVLFFLLLESDPCNWTLEKLADRLSDAVHFLRSSLQSMWLPSFFIHNPHLEKQIPAFQLYPLLTGGRQYNLMANMKTEVTEKVLHFIDQRLDEVGLSRCIKEEYSTEMWEYEFFIFG